MSFLQDFKSEIKVFLAVAVVAVILIGGLWFFWFFWNETQPPEEKLPLPLVETWTHEKAFEEALKQNNPSPCERINKSYILQDFVVSAEQARDDCKVKYAVEKQDVAYCLSLSDKRESNNWSLRDACLQLLAKKLQRPELCDQMPNAQDPDYGQTWRTQCKEAAEGGTLPAENDVLEQTRRLLVDLGELPDNSTVDDVKDYVTPPLQERPFVYFCDDHFLLQHVGGEYHKLEYYSLVFSSFQKTNECKATFEIGNPQPHPASCSVGTTCRPVRDLVSETQPFTIEGREILDVALEVQAPFSTAILIIKNDNMISYTAKERNQEEARDSGILSAVHMEEFAEMLEAVDLLNMQDRPKRDGDPQDGSTYTITITIAVLPNAPPGTAADPQVHSVSCYEFSCEQDFLQLKDKIIELWGKEVLEVGV